MLNPNGYINTQSGRRLNILKPKQDQIELLDIACGLAYNSHFGGQTPHFFSIAEHSLKVCELMRLDGVKDPTILLAALLHDASEAYFGDMLKPIKVLLPKFQELETRLQGVINSNFGVQEVSKSAWKPYDIKAQELEYRCFFEGDLGGVLSYYEPPKARSMFMDAAIRFMTDINSSSKT